MQIAEGRTYCVSCEPDALRTEISSLAARIAEVADENTRLREQLAEITKQRDDMLAAMRRTTNKLLGHVADGSDGASQ